MEAVSNVSGLYRLALTATRQFDVRNLVVAGPDVTIEMATGPSPSSPRRPRGRRQSCCSAVAACASRHRIKPSAPRSGSLPVPTISTSEFDAAFVRLKPSDFESQVSRRIARPAPGRRHRICAARSKSSTSFSPRTLQIDLTDLSRDRWSLVPSGGDLIAEVRTRRFGILTYARSGNEAEDITVFDCRRRRNISLDASADKLAARGRFYSEDDLVDYDILAYEADAAFAPERFWLNGTAHMRVRVRAGAMTTMTLKLAEALTVRGVYAPGFGRLLHLRVVNQNSLIVNLPAPMFRDNEFALTIVYSGRLEPSELIVKPWHWTAPQERERVAIPLEPRFIYSNNCTGIRSRRSAITPSHDAHQCPERVPVVATGTLNGPPQAQRHAGRALRGRSVPDDRPVRYLSCVISRMSSVGSTRMTMRAAAGSSAMCGSPRRMPGTCSGRPPLSRPLAAPIPSRRRPPRATRRTCADRQGQRPAGRACARAGGQASAMLRFYASIVGEAPYPASRWRSPKTNCPADTARPTSRCCIRCSPTRRSRGAAIR